MIKLNRQVGLKKPAPTYDPKNPPRPLATVIAPRPRSGNQLSQKKKPR